MSRAYHDSCSQDYVEIPDPNLVDRESWDEREGNVDRGSQVDEQDAFLENLANVCFLDHVHQTGIRGEYFITSTNMELKAIT